MSTDNNPFRSSEHRKSMADALNQVANFGRVEVPDYIKQAAIVAGKEFGSQDTRTAEVRADIYKRHFDGLKADANLRDLFVDLADREANS